MSETFCYNANPSEGNFTLLNNTCIRDKRLSWKAKGLHTYFMSLPRGWKLFKNELVKHSTDGIDSVNSAIQELVSLGYVEITDQQRTSNGQFAGKAYGFYAKPKKATIDDNRKGLSDTVKPLLGDPKTDKTSQLITNKKNIHKEKTEQTNYSDSPTTVNESVLINVIKGLFGGKYPFDKNFETDVLQHLVDAGIEEENLNGYMNYVYERTKLGNVKKSFEGLFRKLALASSIIRDFKNSCFYRKDEKEQVAGQNTEYIDCPICSNKIDRNGSGCPICGTEMRVLRNSTLPDFIAQKKIWALSEEGKKKYELALASFRENTMREFNRPCVTREQYLQFWKEYGLLNLQEDLDDKD